MSDGTTTPSSTFTVHGDGRWHGDDGSAGELAGTTLYVVRALAQVDQLLGIGPLAGFTAAGGARELEARVGHDGDFGTEVAGTLVATGATAKPVDEHSLAATLGDELDHVLDQVTQVELVAGCFVVSSNGNLLADRVPGVAEDALAGTGRRVKVAYDAFDRFLGTTALVTRFEWADIVAAPVGNGLAVVIADPSAELEAILSAVQVGGGVLSGVDLAVFRGSALLG
ncbi:hypothetical protein [Nocardioides sp. SYSU D00065]|uniref:hypothetical protein n=1 Tax=Nocardioides sp. SYSU D00065 TaxID=2817378 RepID=UPI001B319299|nr:hypothetical protein [Nocardioides sp. SYSU D00065]